MSWEGTLASRYTWRAIRAWPSLGWGESGAAPPLPDLETELNFGRRGLCQSRAQGARSSRGRCPQHPLGGGSPAAAGCQWSPPAKPKGPRGGGAIPSSYPLTVALVLPAWESPGLIRAFLGVAHGAGASSVTLDGACSPITLLGPDPWPGPWGRCWAGQLVFSGSVFWFLFSFGHVAVGVGGVLRAAVGRPWLPACGWQRQRRPGRGRQLGA